MIKGTLRLSCLLLAAALLFSHFSKYIKPDTVALAGFFALGFPVLYLFNILWLIIGILIKEKWWIISLGTLLIALPTAGLYFELCGKGQERKKANASSVKVMNYNVRLFDLYNWSENKSTRNKMFRFIKEQQADILCFQEFYYTTSKKYPFNTLDTLLEFQDAIHYHAAYTTTIRRTDNFGIATFTRFPILDKGEIRFSDGGDNICIYTDIQVHQDTMRIYNMHLSSVKLMKEDYRFIDQLGKDSSHKMMDGSKKIYNKLKLAFEKRSDQIATVTEHIDKSPYPVIVCGDFNDVPASYTYRKFTKKLNDTFLEAGCSSGSTYAGNIPFLRIDYILTSPGFSCSSFQTHSLKYSDHYPITVILDK